jgi:hypothetical protein
LRGKKEAEKLRIIEEKKIAKNKAKAKYDDRFDF